MKKILGIIVIAGTMVACNNSSEAGTSTDTTTVDTNKTVIPVTIDTNTTIGDTLKVDTLKR